MIALVLALAMLFPAALPALAENPEKKETADIEESMVTLEDEDLGSLAENFTLIKDLLKDEEVQGILNNQEVASVTSEIVFRILVWMFQNRSVTMKILAESGVSEADRQSIEKIWDSVDRVTSAYTDYLETEDGKQLQAECEAVKADPDIQQSVADFKDLVTSKDLNLLLQAITEAAKADAAENALEGSQLTQSAVEKEIDDTTFMGTMILQVMKILDQSTWAQDSVPKLAKNENLWKLLTHLANGNQELDQLLRTELKLILGDREINVFIQNLLKKGYALFRILHRSPEQGAETETGIQETEPPEAENQETGNQETGNQETGNQEAENQENAVVEEVAP